MQFSPDAKHLKVKKPVYMKEMGTHLQLFSIVIRIHPCLCFHFIVDEISRNKTKNYPRRLTAVDMWIEFVVGSRPAPREILRFSSPVHKTDISKFQFHLEQCMKSHSAGTTCFNCITDFKKQNFLQ